MPDDTNNGPVDLAAIRQKRSGDPAAIPPWSPGAVLVELARQMAAGEVNPMDLVIVYREPVPNKPGAMRVEVLAGGVNSDPHTAAGMLQDGALVILRKSLAR